MKADTRSVDYSSHGLSSETLGMRSLQPLHGKMPLLLLFPLQLSLNADAAAAGPIAVMITFAVML